jgi:hypothetical protein
VSILDFYLEESKKTKSENSNDVLLRDIEHRYTITELLEFAEALKKLTPVSKWRESELFWLDKFNERIECVPTIYRTDLQLKAYDAIFQYYSQDSVTSRSLLVCFTGAFGGLMLPNWAVLSTLPAKITDVLIITSKKDLGDTSFVRFRNEWPQITDRYREMMSRKQYHRAYVLGVSGGCPAALRFAIENRLRDVFVVAPVRISKKVMVEIDINNVPHKKFARRFPVQVSFLSGSRDYAALRQIPAFLSLFSRVKIKIVYNAGHSVLAVLFRKKRLSEAFFWIKN